MPIICKCDGCGMHLNVERFESMAILDSGRFGITAIGSFFYNRVVLCPNCLPKFLEYEKEHKQKMIEDFLASKGRATDG